LPEGFEKVFYSDNGSTAVEAAIKMAVQYHKNKGADRNKILCFRDAYHGDTFGAMSVSARGVFTDPYARLLFDVVFIDTPDLSNHQQVVYHFKEQIGQHTGEIAGFIFEPLVLGSAGMKMYTPHTLDALLAICKEQGIITIADEVFTGFGRTGRMFAIEHLSQVPDIICLSKGITGGFLPFAATIVQGFIYDPFHGDERTKMLFHGHSYTGNPLGCAAALASLEVFEQEQTMSHVAAIVEAHHVFADEVKNSSVLKDVRQCGTIVALEFKDDLSSGYLSSLRDRMYQFFIARQIILRPLGNVLYILPPYCISGKDLQSIYSAIKEFIATCEA
jgi:adenosylmethionine-8-amino-7-oxononanoate aminotransferase